MNWLIAYNKHLNLNLNLKNTVFTIVNLLFFFANRKQTFLLSPKAIQYSRCF